MGVARRFRQLLGARDGAAAVEFAVLAPLMIIFFLGTIEITNAVRMQARLNVAAGLLAEFVAGQPAVQEGATSSLADQTGGLADMCAGAAMAMMPYNPSSFAAEIASFTNSPANANNISTNNEDWNSDASCAATATHRTGATLRAFADTPYSMFTKSGVSGSGYVPGYSAIVVQVQYRYRNVLPFLLGQFLNFTAVAIARPRTNTTIACTVGSSTTACPQNP